MCYGCEDGWEGWFVKNWYNLYDIGRILSIYFGLFINDFGYFVFDDDDDVMMLLLVVLMFQILRQYQLD